MEVVTDEERKIAEEQLREVGPFSKELDIPIEEFEAMSWPEQQEHLTKLALASSARYGGRPELMMLENPEYDFFAMAEKRKAEGWPPRGE